MSEDAQVKKKRGEGAFNASLPKRTSWCRLQDYTLHDVCVCVKTEIGGERHPLSMHLNSNTEKKRQQKKTDTHLRRGK